MELNSTINFNSWLIVLILWIKVCDQVDGLCRGKYMGQRDFNSVNRKFQLGLTFSCLRVGYGFWESTIETTLVA